MSRFGTWKGSVGSVLALGVLPALLVGCECTPAPEDASTIRVQPTPASKPPPKPKPEGLYASPHRLGPLSNEIAPTVEAVDAVLPDKYTVRAASKEATKGATIEVLLGEAVVLELWPSEDKKWIQRAVAKHEHVVFPWGTRVGIRIGDHKNWARMACKPAEAPFEGKGWCNAFSEARIGYVVEGWKGEGPPPADKEGMVDAHIVGMVWSPDAPGTEKKAPGKPMEIQLVPVEPPGGAE